MVTAGPNLPGFNYCTIPGNPTPVAYSNWRVISLDLSGYIGQSVTLEFETGDCDLGAHYGYAYIDAISCGPIETKVYYCQASDSTLIEGPEGFATYDWSPTGDTTRVMTVPSNTCLLYPYAASDHKRGLESGSRTLSRKTKEYGNTSN